MIKLLTILPLLLSLTVQAQTPADTSARARAQLGPGQRDIRLLPRPGGGYSLFPITGTQVGQLVIDTTQIPVWNSLYQRFKPKSYRPNWNVDIDGKPTYFPTNINNVLHLTDTLLTYATKAQVNAIISGGSDTASAYTRAQANFLLGQRAPLLETNLQLNRKPTDATISEVRSWTQAIPVSFNTNGGNYQLDPLDNTSADNTGTVLVVPGGYRYKRQAGITVDPRWFGARGDGITNDRQAIQTAINYAKTNFAQAGGTYRMDITLAAGFYRVNQALDLTNTNGIWLKGSNGRFINTGLIGYTGGPIIDISGSTQGGIEGLTLISESTDPNRSTIGVLYALTQNPQGQQLGGLNTLLKNVNILMNDYPTANGGLGSIGYLNVRSEEGAVYDGVIKANSGMVLTNQANLAPIGATSFTVTSPFATIAADAGTGSMGVMNLQNISVQNIQKRHPAITLYNANSITFQGYLSREGATDQGGEETAIWAAGSCSNIRVTGTTVESFSRMLRVTTALESGEFAIITANQTQASTDLIDVSGASLIRDVTFKLSIPNLSERPNRYFLWHSPNSNGTEPVGVTIANSKFYCYDIGDNTYAAPGWLVQRMTNTELNTFHALEKKGGRQRLTSNRMAAMGSLGAITAATVCQFREAAINDGSNGKGGGMFITIEGMFQVGAWYVTQTAVRAFRVTIAVNQTNFGVKSAFTPTVTLLDQSTSDPAAINITGVTASLTFSGGVGTITLTPTITGTASGTDWPITYTGEASIRASYHAQDPILLN